MIANFMGGAAAPSNSGTNSSVGVEDSIPANAAGTGGAARGGNNRNNNNNNRRGEQDGGIGMLKFPRQLLRNLFGGLGGGGQGTESTVATETNVAATRGAGATSGLPTCGDDGSIEMVFHQVSSAPRNPFPPS